MELYVYKRGGVFLCLLGVSYLLVCLRIYLVGDALVYEGYIVYLVALIAFTKLGFAIHGNIVNRHLNNPIISTLKMISFTDAVVSIVVTQMAVLTMKGSPSGIKRQRVVWHGMQLFILSGGIWMMLRKTKAPMKEVELIKN